MKRGKCFLITKLDVIIPQPMVENDIIPKIMIQNKIIRNEKDKGREIACENDHGKADNAPGNAHIFGLFGIGHVPDANALTSSHFLQTANATSKLGCPYIISKSSRL